MANGNLMSGRMMHAFLVKNDKSGDFDKNKINAVEAMIQKCKTHATQQNEAERMFWDQDQWRFWADRLQEAMVSAVNQKCGMENSSVHLEGSRSQH